MCSQVELCTDHCRVLGETGAIKGDSNLYIGYYLEDASISVLTVLLEYTLQGH
jgi:hypothetical protein